jgi:HTH-type transcriptional regulator/antitoxin HipB
MWIHTTKDFGELVRRKRKALGLTQEELATRCGVGVRFIVDLEAGKPSCQLGKALTVAAEVGLCRGDISNDRTSTEPPKADEEGPLSQIPNFRTP